MKKILSSAALCLLAGCSSVPSAAPMSCIDARQSVQRFEVLSPTEVRVQSSSRAYHVVVEACDLTRADRIAFSNGPERMVWSGGQPIFATQLYGGQICGRAGETLVWRDHSQDFRFPGHVCRIVSIERIN